MTAAAVSAGSLSIGVRARRYCGSRSSKKRGPHAARDQQGHPDRAGQLGGERPGEADHPELRRAVRGGVADRLDAQGGGDGDDACPGTPAGSGSAARITAAVASRSTATIRSQVSRRHVGQLARHVHPGGGDHRVQPAGLLGELPGGRPRRPGCRPGRTRPTAPRRRGGCRSSTSGRPPARGHRGDHRRAEPAGPAGDQDGGAGAGCTCCSSCSLPRRRGDGRRVRHRRLRRRPRGPPRSCRWWTGRPGTAPPPCARPSGAGSPPRAASARPAAGGVVAALDPDVRAQPGQRRVRGRLVEDHHRVDAAQRGQQPAPVALRHAPAGPAPSARRRWRRSSGRRPGSRRAAGRPAGSPRARRAAGRSSRRWPPPCRRPPVPRPPPRRPRRRRSGHRRR